MYVPHGELGEDGTFPVHLWESMGIWWVCVCPIQCTRSKVHHAGWKIYQSMYTYVVQNDLRRAICQLLAISNTGPQYSIWPWGVRCCPSFQIGMLSATLLHRANVCGF
jgi:hypothetical protein